MHKPTFPPERCASTVGVRFQRIELPLDPGELPTMIAAGTHRAIVLTKRSAGQPDGLVVFDGRTWSRPKPRCPVVDWMDATTVGDTLYALGQSAHPPGTVELTVGRTTRCSVVPIAGGAYLLRDPLSWVRCGVSGDCGIRTFDTGRLLLRFERSDLLFFPGSKFRLALPTRSQGARVLESWRSAFHTVPIPFGPTPLHSRQSTTRLGARTGRGVRAVRVTRFVALRKGTPSVRRGLWACTRAGWGRLAAFSVPRSRLSPNLWDCLADACRALQGKGRGVAR